MTIKEWTDQLTDRQVTIYGTLLVIILVTIPCYLVAILALIFYPLGY